MHRVVHVAKMTKSPNARFHWATRRSRTLPQRPGRIEGALPGYAEQESNRTNVTGNASRRRIALNAFALYCAERIAENTRR